MMMEELRIEAKMRNAKSSQKEEQHRALRAKESKQLEAIYKRTVEK